jgi:hypothetical protein
VTWLVLCDSRDRAALWAHERLSALGLAPLELVTSGDLAGAGFEHRIDEEGASTVITLTDGRAVRSAEVRGTLNRLASAPAADLARLPPGDRDYALQELHALYLSWLHSLPGSLLNPPDHRGLCGAWRPPSQWADLGGRAGLAVRRDVFPTGLDEDQPGAPVGEDAIVVGEHVFSRLPLTPAATAGCVRLAALAGTPILGIRFEDAGSDRAEVLAWAGPLPDLRLGGEPLVEALADALRASREAA